MSKIIANLLSDTNLVQVPYVSVKIGSHTLGVFKRSSLEVGTSLRKTITYPNYIEKLTVTKINGQFNQYELTLKYPLTPGKDPNLIDKMLSSVGIGGKIYFTYGDYNSPVTTYKEEEAIILSSTFNMVANSPILTYTITAAAEQSLVEQQKFKFPATTAKPSTIIKNLISNPSYRLSEFFPAANLSYIASDDNQVYISEKINVSAFEYLTYLVSCMTPIDGNAESYMLSLYSSDEGMYFKVNRISSGLTQMSTQVTYTVDVGYPSTNLVKSFDVKENNTWSIYYNYNKDVVTDEYVERIDNNGNTVPTYAPVLTANKYSGVYDSSEKSWWNQVVSYPIEATLVLRGLLAPAVLASYISVNVYYYGQKHISSGVYIITEQVDTIRSGGYDTTLTLLRVGGDI